ncbi:MAG: hypothetical protein NC041_05450 [Bacteroides sp.]|nr:hypothetical protein [Prevotella sp.]MCM1407402.1 hypothetical protein [Treponema brennaborense]MCM1469892.1 hypothetical protein [Bacteroides sp.]
MKHIISRLALFFAAVFSVSAAPTVAGIHIELIAHPDRDAKTIHITWEKPDSPQTLREAAYYFLYRDTKQILRPDIAALTPAAKIPADFTSYIDDPAADFPDMKAGTAWYYAVLPGGNDGIISDVIIPAVNASVIGAVPVLPRQKPLPSAPKRTGADSAPNRMLIPLPYLNMTAETQLSEDKTLSPEAVQSIASLKPARASSKKLLKPHIFDEEKQSGAVGEQYLLSDIATGSFSAGDWITAENELKKFLQVNRSSAVVNRAKFYLAEVLYYKGYYREALTLLIEAEEISPTLTQKWIQAVLDIMPAVPSAGGR